MLAQARTPEGQAILLRLQFRKGLSVEGKALPRAFLTKAADVSGWVSFENLSPQGKRWALAALFPEDQWRQEEVRHRVGHPDVESVWTMAALFTGHGQNYDRLMGENPDLPEKLREGDVWRIPRSLLSADLGGPGKRARPLPARGRTRRRGPRGGLPWTALLRRGRPGQVRRLPHSQGRGAVFQRGHPLHGSGGSQGGERTGGPYRQTQWHRRCARASSQASSSRSPCSFLADPFQSEGSSGLGGGARGPCGGAPHGAGGGGSQAQGRADHPGCRPWRGGPRRPGQRPLGIRFRLRHHHAGAAPPRTGNRCPGEQHHPLPRPRLPEPRGDPDAQPRGGDPHQPALRRGR